MLGDPQFVGLRGQSYQVHGLDSTTYNLISDAMVTVNALFTFLSHGDCPTDSAGRALFVCWSHAGSYLSAVSVRLADGHTLVVRAGGARQGFASVQVDGSTALTVGSNITLPSGMTVSYDSMRVLTVYDAGLYHVTLQNSDGFVNLLSLQVSNWSRLVDEVQSHGLIGQTWQAGTRGAQVRYVEGLVDEYVVEQGLLGYDFSYSRMRC